MFILGAPADSLLAHYARLKASPAWDLVTVGLTVGGYVLGRFQESRKEQKAERKEKKEARTKLVQNVQSTCSALDALIANVNREGQTTPLLRGRLEECRQEFSGIRPSLAVMDNPSVVARVGDWHADIQATTNSIFNEESAWVRYMNSGQPVPQGMHIMPARKRLAEYTALRERGQELVSW